MSGGSRIYGYKVPSEYPKRYDAPFRHWAIRQPFPFDGILEHEFNDEGFSFKIIAMTMGEWKFRDHQIRRGEKALFWLGNRPFWTNRQVRHVDRYAFWQTKENVAYSKGEIKAGGYGTDWEYEAGDAMGGPFF